MPRQGYQLHPDPTVLPLVARQPLLTNSGSSPVEAQKNPGQPESRPGLLRDQINAYFDRSIA
jgi:hypothetical protein